MRLGAQPQEHITDVMVHLDGFLEPGRISVIGLFQPERPGIGHLTTGFINEPQVNENRAVFLLQGAEPFS